jgi:hypothetical protein
MQNPYHAQPQFFESMAQSVKDWLNGEWGQGGSITRGMQHVKGGGGAEPLPPSQSERDTSLQLLRMQYMPVALAAIDADELSPSISGNVIGFTVHRADTQMQPEQPVFVQMAPSVFSASVHIAQVLPITGMVPEGTLPLGYA